MATACPRCGSRRLISYTDAFGRYWDCESCGAHLYPDAIGPDPDLPGDTDGVLTWAAGVLDQAGSLFVTNGPALVLELQTPRRDLLDLLRDRFGGTVGTVVRRDPRRAAAWRWNLYGRGVARALEQLLPNFRTERMRELAELAVRLGRESQPDERLALARLFQARKRNS